VVSFSQDSLASPTEAGAEDSADSSVELVEELVGTASITILFLFAVITMFAQTSIGANRLSIGENNFRIYYIWFRFSCFVCGKKKKFHISGTYDFI
jgi:hypothetical protein